MDEDSICYQCKHCLPDTWEFPDNDAAPGYQIHYDAECDIGYDGNFGTTHGCYEYIDKNEKPIVHCRECKYWYHTCRYWDDEGVHLFTRPIDYCSRGEKGIYE